MDQIIYYILLFLVFVFIIRQYKHITRHHGRRLYIEKFMDAIAVDPMCAGMTAQKLFAKYNGDLNKLANDLHAIGATPDVINDPANMPKIATALKMHGLITCL